jgi:hypothetical protein
MPFKPFPSELQCMTFSNEIKQLGKYNFAETMELKAARLYFTHHNSSNLGAKFRLRFCFYEDANLYFALTEWLTLSDLVSTASYWLGWVTFQFEGSAVIPVNTDFYVFAETQDYTETFDNFVGAILDDVPSVNTKLANDDFGAAIEFIRLT